MNYTFTLTEQEINTITAGVAKLPFETAAPIFENLRHQINKQNAEIVPPAGDTPVAVATPVDAAENVS